MSDSNKPSTNASSNKGSIAVRIVPQDDQGDQEATASPASLWPTDEQFLGITQAFTRLSTQDVPDARLVLSYTPGPIGAASILPTAAQPADLTLSGWNTATVVQRAEDVDFAFSIPFHDGNSTAASSKGKLRTLGCRILYDPASDVCVLVNTTNWPLAVGNIRSQSKETLKSYDESANLEPDYWRIYAGMGVDGKEGLQAVADILVLERRFRVSIHDDAKASATGKRGVSMDNSLMQDKKTKLLKETEILVHRSTNAAYGELSVQADNNNLTLDHLQDGQVAVVSTIPNPESKKDFAKDTYTIKRTGGIANVSTTLVFSGLYTRMQQTDTRMQQTNNVVAKVLRDDCDVMQDRVDTWKTERDILKQLHHPNIVSLIDYDARLFVFYLEHLPRSLVRDINARFSAQENVAILRDAAAALAYMHEKGIHHSDIKPANIAYSPARGAVVLDFGMAVDTKASMPVVNGGTHWYLPPESKEDNANASDRGPGADVWALGVTLLYTLGIIPLPEFTERGRVWAFNMVGQPGKARDQMNAWLAKVFEARERLCREDGKVQGIVYEMLPEKPELRITAAQIIARLA